jgi:gas vesicle protein
MNQKRIEKLTVISGLAMAISALIPIAKTTIVTIMGQDGTKNLVNRVKSVVQYAKEEIEDIVAEAQFERLKKRLAHEIEDLEVTEVKDEVEEAEIGRSAK